MYEFSDDFYTEKELKEIHRLLLTDPKWYVDGECRLAMYKLCSKNGFTGKVMLIGVNNISDTCKAINREWSNSGITAIIGGMSEVIPRSRIQSVYDVLRKSRYETKYPELLGADKVFNYGQHIEDIVQIL